ncbi:MAG: hypothetical protein KIT54_10075 [Phycisphaeraceae bacterium]|nr:hypothetical protein [Phycisphaeraceae bacterium]
MKTTALALLATASVALAQASDVCEAQRVLAPPDVPTVSFNATAITNGRHWFLSASQASTLCPGAPISCATGAVFVYELDGNEQLVHVQTIVPHDVRLYDGFGISMDVDGDRLIVGALNTQWPGSELRQGAVFVYEHDGEEWVEVARIRPPDEVRQEFGVSLLLDGDMALAKQLSVDRVHRYARSPEGWTWVESVQSPDGLPGNSCFGCTSATGNGWLFFGAHRDGSLVRDGGSVYVYRRHADGTLEFAQKIASADVSLFGNGLDFDGTTLAVGAIATNRTHTGQGVVRTYTLVDGAWTLEQEITHRRARQMSRLGSHVHISGATLYATAMGDTVYRPQRIRGMTYVFQRDATGQWVETRRLLPNPPGRTDQYGTAIASAGSKVLVESRLDWVPDRGTTGAAYLFDLDVDPGCIPCRADLDGDGVVTIFDFLEFQNLFAAGDLRADFDGDGRLTALDYLFYEAAFLDGCD